MNTNEIKEQKQDLRLTSRQRAIIVGLVLGDGHLETQNSGKTYRLKVEHAESQGDYVHWLFNELQEWIPATAPYLKVRANGERNVGFNTYSHASLRFYGHQFYDKKKKKIPKMIAKLVEPISIAVWFMDDGSRKSARHHTYNLHTLGYSKNDLEVLQDMLKKRFGISAMMHRQKEKYWRLYIPSESAASFGALIDEYVRPIKSMAHKLITHA